MCRNHKDSQSFAPIPPPNNIFLSCKKPHINSGKVLAGMDNN